MNLSHQFPTPKKKRWWGVFALWSESSLIVILFASLYQAKRLQLADTCGKSWIFQGHKAKKSLRSQLAPDAELVLEAADEKVGEEGRVNNSWHDMTCYNTNQIHFKYTTVEYSWGASAKSPVFQDIGPNQSIKIHLYGISWYNSGCFPSCTDFPKKQLTIGYMSTWRRTSPWMSRSWRWILPRRTSEKRWEKCILPNKLTSITLSRHFWVGDFPVLKVGMLFSSLGQLSFAAVVDNRKGSMFPITFRLRMKQRTNGAHVTTSWQDPGEVVDQKTRAKAVCE